MGHDLGMNQADKCQSNSNAGTLGADLRVRADLAMLRVIRPVVWGTVSAIVPVLICKIKDLQCRNVVTKHGQRMFLCSAHPRAFAY